MKIRVIQVTKINLKISQAAAAQGQLASSPAGIPTLDSSAQGISLAFFSLILSELSTAENQITHSFSL